MIKDFLEFYEDDSFFKSANYKNEIEEWYSNIIASMIGVIKCDVVNDEYLRYIQRLKKDISKKTNNQSKVMMSSFKEAAVSEFRISLERYNVLHFMKFITRIMDEDDKYQDNVERCKELFSDKICLEVTQHLYNCSSASAEDLSVIFGLNDNLPMKYNELFSISKVNGSERYSLTTKARNLYAFFIMKNISPNEGNGQEEINYNEGKVNEVLEYLIQYMSSSSKENKNIKRPVLHSGSANNNLERLLMLLDEQDRYGSYPIFKDIPKDKMDYFEKGNPECKKTF